MLIFDIETGPLPDTVLAALCPEFTPPPHPGEFDKSAVRVGNLGPDKAAEKIAAARMAHEVAVANYDRDRQLAAEQHFADFKSKAALDPTTGRVLAIGFQAADDAGKVAIEDGGGDEAKLIDAYWRKYAKCRATPGRPRRMVGCNITGFDLPFLVRRSWILGVDVPATVRPDRYWDSLFVDIRDRWLLGQRWGDCQSSLDTMATALGCGAKNGDGAEFARLWLGTAEERQQAVAYLRNDLAITVAVAKRLGVV